MYPNLKLAIFKSGMHQNRLARDTGINEVILSKIIHGHKNPSEQQRALLAGYLQADEGWLFERFENGSRPSGGLAASDSKDSQNERT
jgi:transcriptional regulator with XRE-family HTH domain